MKQTARPLLSDDIDDQAECWRLPDVSNNDDQERVFRDFETRVLDVHHESLPLWRHDRQIATYAALAQFDCWAILSLFMPPQLSGVGITQRLKGTEEGLSQAIRWLHPGKQQFDLAAASDKDIIGEAGEFCAFATKYVDIADFHKMYGRGQVLIEVDEAKRTIHFVSQPGRPPAAALFPMAEQTHRISRLPSVRGSDEMLRLGASVHKAMKSAGYSYVEGRIALDDVRIANDEALIKQMTLAFSSEPLPLSPNTDLGGFTVQEFCDFFEALRRWSFCCTFLFMSSLLKGGKQQWECIPTQAVERNQFLQSIQTLSGVPQDRVETITARLTYDDRTEWPEVFQQPLFCGPKTVAWSVSIAQSSRYMRNMLKLMSRTKNLEKQTATLIGGREGAMLRELGEEFSRKGRCSFKLNIPIQYGDKQGEVDLLMYNDKFPDELLVVEGKAVLGVDEINEVESATKEMQKAQRQLSRVIDILKSLPDSDKQKIWTSVKWALVTGIYGVVVAADAEPNDKFDHSAHPGISLQTIKDRLRKNHFASPKKFWNACKERRWMDPLRNYQESHRKISVGDVTYELPILKEPVEQSKERQKQMLRRAEESKRMAKKTGRKSKKARRRR